MIFYQKAASVDRRLLFVSKHISFNIILATVKKDL